MQLDLLVIAAHPDDTEMSAGGTVIKHIDQGYTAGIVDLTQGELGTRGTPERRLQEAEEAGRRMGLSVRENLGLRDGFFRVDETHIHQIIRVLRRFRPRVLLTNAPTDRHPDHGRAAQLVTQSVFYSGLRRIEMQDEQGNPLPPWRPGAVYHFIQFNYLTPTFVVDIRGYEERKIHAVQAYESQFYNPESKEPDTILSHHSFMDFLRARELTMGSEPMHFCGEGFLAARIPSVDNLFTLG
jgi:bacillithiol biosynthesis deacetylase BshB1